MSYKRKKHRTTRRKVACLLLTGIFMLSGCGNEKEIVETAETVETVETEQPPQQEEVSENLENSAVEPEEDTKSEEILEEEIPLKEEENPEPVENKETVADLTPIQGKYPVQISTKNSMDEEETYFFDSDGDLIRLETKELDGTTETKEIEYVLDGQGNKMYGITEVALQDTDFPLKYSALDHKLAEKPLINVEKSTWSGSDDVYKTTFSYDADNRITSKTEGRYEAENVIIRRQTDYTYEEQDGNLIVTSVDEDFKRMYTYNSDNYLTLYRGESVEQNDSSFSGFSEDGYEYDANNWLTTNSYKSSREGMDSNTRITHDAKGNILSINSIEYEGYDENGNWMVCTYYANDGKIDCFLVCEYDENGNRLTKSFGFGDELRTAFYNYDDEGRLLDIHVDERLLYQFTYNEKGLMECVEQINEYEFSEAEKKIIYQYVLAQELRQEVEEYVGEYTGILSSDDSSANTISYQKGAVFRY